MTREGQRYDVAANLGAGAGWRLSAERDVLSLHGELCSAAKRGRFESIDLELGCVALPALLGL